MPRVLHPDVELVPAFAALWIWSTTRVAIALYRNESFGFEPTSALLMMFALPLLIRTALRSLFPIRSAQSRVDSLSRACSVRGQRVD